MIAKCERCKKDRECVFRPLRHQLDGPDATEDEATDGILLCGYCIEHFEAEVERAIRSLREALGDPEPDDLFDDEDDDLFDDEDQDSE